VSTLEGVTGWANSIVWSHDGSRLAVALRDKTVKVWDPATGQTVSILEGHNELVFLIAWSPDGSRLASGSADHTVKIWDLATGHCASTFSISSPGFLQFDKTNLSHLHTSLGIFNIASTGSATTTPPILPSVPEQYGYGLNYDYSWITCDGVNLLWLPAEYRPAHPSLFAISAMTLAIGCSSGRVVFLSLLEHNPTSGF
jgi:WD40 repeat protein